MVMGAKLYISLAAIILSNIVCICFLQQLIARQQVIQPSALSKALAHDVDRAWPTNVLPVIAISVDNSLRYQLNSTGDSEWAALLPNNGTIYLGSQRKPYTISMFHQLRCLDTLRRYIMRHEWSQSHRSPTSAEEKRDLTQDCVVYLRQMIVCRADTALEDHVGKPASLRAGLARCKDWRVVYEALQRNNMEI